MLTKFISRPYPLHSFTFISSSHNPFFPKSFTISLLSTATATTTTTAAAAASQSTTFDLGFTYGPSLRKGHKPLKSLTESPSVQQISENDEVLLDEDNFTRVFDIAALRVPSDRCFSLENRLRGHLLNWPRIRNIARVDGDEVEDELKDFVKDSRVDEGDVDGLMSLDRRIYGKAEGDGEKLSPVLYRDKLAKTFNSTGFEHFRNLAKLSRPKRRKKKEGEGEGGEKKGVKRNELYLVEVVDDGSEDDDLSGLLGDDFKGRKWRGSTRLLLMDEQYANKSMEEMPRAVKAVFKEDGAQDVNSAIEVVRCKLTLFYSYWQMNEILESLLPEGMIVPSAFETVGHIAHLNLRDEHLTYKKLIAKVVLDKHKPKIQTVVNKIDAIHNDYRTMQLEVLAGNHSLVTTLTENGLRFHVDLATVYWNSRLGTERQRLLSGFRQHDVVCDVFAGVGPIAIPAARKVSRVYANDLNPQAVDYLERNCVLNKLERKIEVFNMDGRRFIHAMFTSQKALSITQVVMNLPKDAAEFLDSFRGIYSGMPRHNDYTLPRIHVYGFSKARDPEFDFHERIRIALEEVAFKVEMHRVRLVAPGKWMLCASFMLPEKVAFAKRAQFDD